MADQDWGIQSEYEDASGRLRAAPPETVDRVRVALGATARRSAGPTFAAAGTKQQLPGVVEIEAEDGRTFACDGEVPVDLPFGYHRAVDTSGSTSPLIVTPRRCMLPPQARSFGFAVQLYAARSRRSWGIGDLGDLRALASWSARMGASQLLVNPLHAPLPVQPQQASPYAPSSRRYRNPLYIDIESVPGIDRMEGELTRAREQCSALLADRVIDRDAVYRLKMRVLEGLWELIRDEPRLDLFAAADPGVVRYATFCALTDRYGSPWRRWPDAVRHPRNAGVERYRRDNERRVRFHVWLQWLLDSQLADAARANGLIHDLAVGLDRHGADAWEWQDVIADAVDIGAPPDEFNTRGQNWELVPFDPWRLRAAGYRPFIETIRAVFRHARGLRIDHVMGLFRLFWIPSGAPADAGVYVRYPASDLLDIVALESARAGAFVAGEDLGTVEAGTRDQLAARDVLTNRLLWFEPDPAGFPMTALGSVTTHDLPTVAGLWDGSDLAAQRSLGLEPNEEATGAILRRIRAATGLDESAPIDEVVVAVHALLARAPSMVLTATLEDMLAVRERPNMPGTADAWPNWSLALPLVLEDAMEASLPARVAEALRRA